MSALHNLFPPHVSVNLSPNGSTRERTAAATAAYPLGGGNNTASNVLPTAKRLAVVALCSSSSNKL